VQLVTAIAVKAALQGAGLLAICYFGLGSLAFSIAPEHCPHGLRQLEIRLRSRSRNLLEAARVEERSSAGLQRPQDL